MMNQGSRTESNVGNNTREQERNQVCATPEKSVLECAEKRLTFLSVMVFNGRAEK